jgi:hypothetical protein
MSSDYREAQLGAADYFNAWASTAVASSGGGTSGVVLLEAGEIP